MKIINEKTNEKLIESNPLINQQLNWNRNEYINK